MNKFFLQTFDYLHSSRYRSIRRRLNDNKLYKLSFKHSAVSIRKIITLTTGGFCSRASQTRRQILKIKHKKRHI